MTIEVATFLAIGSFILSVSQFIMRVRNGDKKESKDSATVMSTIIVKLDNIGNDVGDIKRDIRDDRRELNSHAERIVRLEQQVKTLNHSMYPSNNAERSE